MEVKISKGVGGCGGGGEFEAIEVERKEGRKRKWI